MTDDAKPALQAALAAATREVTGPLGQAVGAAVLVLANNPAMQTATLHADIKLTDGRHVHAEVEVRLRPASDSTRH